MPTRKPDGTKHIVLLKKQLGNQLSVYQRWLNRPSRAPKATRADDAWDFGVEARMPSNVVVALQRAYRLAVRILHYRPTDSAALFVVERLKADPQMEGKVDFTYEYAPFKARSDKTPEERAAAREAFWRMMEVRQPERYASHMELKAKRDAAKAKRDEIVAKRKAYIEAVDAFRLERQEYFKGVELFMKAESEANIKAVVVKMIEGGKRGRGRPKKGPVVKMENIAEAERRVAELAEREGKEVANGLQETDADGEGECEAQGIPVGG